MSSKEISDGSTTQDEQEVPLPEKLLEGHLTEKPIRLSEGSTQDEQDIALSGNILEEPATELPIGPPPDGGFAAWLQVLGAFLLFFNSW